MRIAEMGWMEVEAYLARDDRAVLPVGSVEQHAYLSLATDSILAERVAVEAAEPLGVPVFPALAYGITPAFLAYPGTLSLRAATHAAVLRDLLDSLAATGFRRVLVVNGHGGNTPGFAFLPEWERDHPGVRVRVHSWWNAPRVWATVRAIDPEASHASWMESFPWTRVAAARVPAGRKAPVEFAPLREKSPAEVRAALGDGCFGGAYERAAADHEAVWREGVVETRAAIAGPWAPAT